MCIGLGVRDEDRREKRSHHEVKCDVGSNLMCLFLAVILDGLWNNVDGQCVQSSGGTRDLNPFNITLHLYMQTQMHTHAVNINS